MTGARPHQQAISVSSHWKRPGRNSRKTVVSSTRLPPAPKAVNETKRPSTYQFGDAPATIANMAHRNSEQLKANLRPMTSAPKPQN